jgi:hypothetical protein
MISSIKTGVITVLIFQRKILIKNHSTIKWTSFHCKNVKIIENLKEDI